MNLDRINFIGILKTTEFSVLLGHRVSEILINICFRIINRIKNYASVFIVPLDLFLNVVTDQSEGEKICTQFHLIRDHIEFLCRRKIQKTFGIVMVFKSDSCRFACTQISDYRFGNCQFTAVILYIDNYFVNPGAVSVDLIIRICNLTYIIGKVFSGFDVFCILDIVLIVLKYRKCKVSICIIFHDHVFAFRILHQILSFRICGQFEGELLVVQCPVSGQSLGTADRSVTCCSIGILKDYFLCVFNFFAFLVCINRCHCQGTIIIRNRYGNGIFLF